MEATQFDHTSVLRYLTDKWQLGPLGRRTASANSIGTALRRDQPRDVGLSRIELTAAQLDPPDPEAEKAAFGAICSHQSALQKLATYLEDEALANVLRAYSFMARFAEAVRAGAQYVLERALQEPPKVKVSIAAPDKIAGSREGTSKDSAARFIMRVKRYAAAGLVNRLADDTLPAEQRQHALQTLAVSSGRNFHHEADDTKLAAAQRWLSNHVLHRHGQLSDADVRDLTAPGHRLSHARAEAARRLKRVQALSPGKAQFSIIPYCRAYSVAEYTARRWHLVYGYTRSLCPQSAESPPRAAFVARGFGPRSRRRPHLYQCVGTRDL